MKHNWSRPPPLPHYGDIDPDQTFLQVGRVMSAWESIEFMLSIIHAAFNGDRRGEAMRLYGQKRNLPGRLADFKAAEAYFVKNPDQHKESALNALIGRVKILGDYAVDKPN